MLQLISEAVKELNPNIIWGLPSDQTWDSDRVGHVCLLPPHDGNTYDDLNWHSLPDGISQPTREEVESKLAELNAGEAMRLLRIERDRLIAETDWWVLPDRTPTDEQLAYRQALRDLPANSTPALDEDGNLDLSSVTWPTKP